MSRLLVGESETYVLSPIDRSDMNHNELPRKTAALEVAAKKFEIISNEKYASSSFRRDRGILGNTQRIMNKAIMMFVSTSGRKG